MKLGIMQEHYQKKKLKLGKMEDEIWNVPQLAAKENMDQEVLQYQQ